MYTYRRSFVEVFDADKLGKDKSLGKVEVDILDLAADEGRWFPLQGKKNSMSDSTPYST